MRRALVVVALVAVIGGFAYASDNVRGARVEMPNLDTTPMEGSETVHTLDYFVAGPAGTYTWTGLFYMSNMFKPDPAWYPFGIMTVEVNPGRVDNATTTGAVGIIDGVRVFTGAGPTVNVAAERFNLTGSVGTWLPVNFTAGSAVIMNSGNFWAGMFNSTSGDGGLQGSATGWVAPPVEPMECVGTAGGSPTAAAGGPWTLHDAGNCGDQYGTTSAATVRVMVDDTVPVELMRFSVE